MWISKKNDRFLAYLGIHNRIQSLTVDFFRILHTSYALYQVLHLRCSVMDQNKTARMLSPRGEVACKSCNPTVFKGNNSTEFLFWHAVRRFTVCVSNFMNTMTIMQNLDANLRFEKTACIEPQFHLNVLYNCGQSPSSIWPDEQTAA